MTTGYALQCLVVVTLVNSQSLLAAAMVNGKAEFALHDLGDSEKSEEFLHCVSVPGNWGRVV